MSESYDPDASFPLLRETLALVAARCERPCLLPRAPTSEALARMESAEAELSTLDSEERKILAYYGLVYCEELDGSSETDTRVPSRLSLVEDAAPVANLLLDDVFENPETLEETG